MSKVKHYIYRSAVSGQIVTKDFALQNPQTTVRETVFIEKKEKVEYIAVEETKLEK